MLAEILVLNKSALYRSASLAFSFVQFISGCSLTNSTSSGRLLDLVFASHPTVIQVCHVVPGISDHDAVLFEVNMSPKCPPKPPRDLLQFHKADFDGLRSHLSSFATTYLDSNPVNRSVDENWNIIAEGIKEAIDNYIPHKISKAKRHLPWVSPAIKRMINKRDRAYKRARRTGKPEHRKAYKQLRNATLKRIRDTHEKYLNEIMGGLQPAYSGNTIGGGVKRAWSYLKLLRAESTGISTLFWNNRVCASDRAKAEIMRQQYESVFTREDLCAMPLLGPSLYPDIPELTVSELGVMKLLQKIDTSKAAGPDLIQARILKEAAVELTPILTSLFQQSYDSGLLPADWKKS